MTTIGEVIGDNLAQLRNFPNQTYLARNSRPVLEFVCKEFNIARICQIILENAIQFSSRNNCQYRVENEGNRVFLISYRKDDKVGDFIDKEYISELTERIQKYLLEASFKWVYSDTEAAKRFQEKEIESKQNKSLELFVHDKLGYNLPDLFVRILQCDLPAPRGVGLSNDFMKNKSLFTFRNDIVPDKLALLCPRENLVYVTEAINDIVTNLTKL